MERRAAVAGGVMRRGAQRSAEAGRGGNRRGGFGWTQNLELLSEVALLRDLPGRGLARGQVRTVVEILAAGAVEVEFSEDQGRTYATAALQAGDLVRLHHRPLEQVA